MKKLGDRLARDARISEADYRLLERVADAYQAELDRVEQALRRVGFQATTRVKTTGTLVDKLRRDTTLKLNMIHDLAGARIVVDGGRLEQDRAVERIVEEFAPYPKASVVKDRRQTPSFGYRAVHVIVFPEGTPVEIQVRTKLQDAWAQIVEKLGDRWGRGLRYGAGPDLPDEPADGFEDGVTRAEVVARVSRLADLIDVFEANVQEEAVVREQLLTLDPAMRANPMERLARVSEQLRGVRDMAEDMLATLLSRAETQGDAG
jgi:ppGpp synthetase/RelA/SpoT-type nucleotidyltranferase